jgi:hypothetical protein
MNIKVKVVKTFNNSFSQKVLPIGFETEIIPILSTTEKIIPAWILKKWYMVGIKPFELCPEKIIPIGNFEGYSFIGIDGFKYNEKFLGKIPLDEIFEKIK